MLMCQGVWLRPSLGGLALPLAAALLASPSWAQAPAANLLVSWRVSAQAEQRQVAAQVAQGLTVQTGRRQHDQVQSVMVLNGGQARVFMGRSVPGNTWQLAWQGGVVPGATPGATPGVNPQAWAVTQTHWVDLGEGLTVRPRWPGGRGPVTVELEASARRPVPAGDLTMAGGGAYEPDGQSRRTEVLSTVTVPLGEWTVVARRGEQVQRQQAGTWSTRQIDHSAQEVLEIRVSLP